ncbi:hypothetical protein BDK51DRAFT_39920 [Blyttiomyces helicus]|uniref:Uncharacterized protein n=1 Tax=Blyttiomyces helicus TaxID=388810 RepID=A0A4P9W9L7_9FUNG|nr:hypothetical protein BDK51DRAFT_39920 [Blyttiomyces helicus]|eukprot:RKO88872.1 hypothetical protein BDK51DRAFT_39920 [Blyttiomyces helicus]
MQPAVLQEACDHPARYKDILHELPANRSNPLLVAALARVAACHFAPGRLAMYGFDRTTGPLAMDVLILAVSLSKAWLLVLLPTSHLARARGLSAVRFHLGVARMSTGILASCCIGVAMATNTWIIYPSVIIAGVIFLVNPHALALLSHTIPANLHGGFFSFFLSILILAEFSGEYVRHRVHTEIAVLKPGLHFSSALFVAANVLLLAFDGKWIEEASVDDGDEDERIVDFAAGMGSCKVSA